MAISIGHLKRYKDIARLLAKHGRAIRDLPVELVADSGPAELSATPAAEELARDLEALGPTFVKLGQVLATRADLLPVPYLTALARLQDDVEPFPFAEVEAIVERELGVRISKAFSSFEETPLAAASLGQVHRAALRDGRQVVVKVQRPGVQETIAEDLAALGEVAGLLDAHTAVGRRYQFRGLVEEFEKSLARELDYRLEAKNLVELAGILEGFERIVVPQPIEDFTRATVLTMDYVRGRKITKIGPLARLEMDGAALADELFRAYLHQVLVAGFFHADPHPGNVFLSDDGRLALLDLGMVGRVSPALQERLLRLLLAVSEGRGEEAAEIAAAIGEKLPDYDEAVFMRAVSALVAENRSAELQQIAVGKLMLDVSHKGAEAGVRLPPELALLGKTLLHLDEIGRTLDPEFDPNGAIRRHAAEITSERLKKSLSPGNVLGTLNELKDFVAHLPGRANKILDRVANNELEVRVDAIDEALLMEGFQKVANRITVGLVLAALIVGAAMLMQVPSSFRILGYPGLAIACFLGAAAGGVTLVVNILWQDRRTRKMATRR
jgi:predicted unusual protein kinase regulating ubiquinone biosynthesis (AarF/ABC1/UbiB family)